MIDPVVMAPLRREWARVQADIDKHLASRRKVTTAKARKSADQRIADALRGFVEHLAGVRILDPACGSGNFLFVAIQELLHLEKEVLTFAARPDIGFSLVPQVRPTQLHGIELSPYAAELAQVVIWIGYLQWMWDNGYNAPRDPILENLTTIENRDAIIAYAGDTEQDASAAVPAAWPEADYIIGNPPFLGSKVFRQNGLHDAYLDAMYASYDLPNTSDLCCYWFERARQLIEHRPELRVGLLATQGIRGGDNRKTLQRIGESARLFMAWSDLPWVLDGANVHVSIVGFTGTPEAQAAAPQAPEPAMLDGQPVDRINANLTGSIDLTAATKLAENSGVSFMGDTKGGAFDIEWPQSLELLPAPNPHGRSNSEVLRPWVNGRDITKRSRGMWIIDFGCTMGEQDAAKYELPFQQVKRDVKPLRDKNKRKTYRDNWWRHVEPRPAMLAALPNDRCIVTPNVTKFRFFRFLDRGTLPDHQLIAFARSDDYFFGVLHSSVHELWARGLGSQLREVESGFRYTPTSCFETFALPWAPGEEYLMSVLTLDGSDAEEAGRIIEEHEAEQTARFAAVDRIGAAAAELDKLRENWLNPPEWIGPIEKMIDAADDFTDVPEDARPLIRQSAIMAAAAQDQQLKKRTLTNLYNQRPTWLKLAHHELDRAVLAAYALTDPEGGWQEDWADVWQETGAGQPLPEDADPEAKARRAVTDEALLSALLRLNRQRAEG